MSTGGELDSSEEFPYLAHAKPRPGQIDMIRECREALRSGGFHLAAAPTGIGKTAAALAAALEIAEATPNKKTIFFLTSRQSQHRIVVDTVRRINALRREQDPVTLVDMIGQSGMCVQPFAKESSHVFSMLCSGARREKTCKPWLTKAPGLTKRILDSPLHVDELVDLAKIHRVDGQIAQTCPWKAAREAANHADVFVGDYNHLFDEGVRSSSLEAMGLPMEDIIIIVDEAHNLPDRIRMTMERVITPTIARNATMELEEYTGALTAIYQTTGADSTGLELDLATWALGVMKIVRQKTADLFRQLHNDLTGDVNELNVEVDRFNELFHKACDEYEGISGQQTLSEEQVQSTARHTVKKEHRMQLLADVLNRCDIDLDVGEGEDPMEPDSHRLGHILDCVNGFGSTTALCLVFSAKGKEGKITSHLLDPGLVSGPVFKETAGAILMSGTLYPPQMYADMLALPTQKTTKTAYDSPFAGERRPVLVAGDVSTKYTQRSPAMWDKIRSHIQALIEGTPGHIAVFAPSYKMMEEILANTHFQGVRKIIESREWSKNDIDRLVEDLRSERSAGKRILLCGVYGARLSEGIDYNGGILDAVACIGIPNAPPSVLSSALKDYASDRFGANNAWRYTVTQPAINAILQAMGRPIRSIGDRALILLLDQRHTDRTYATCYPRDLRMNATNTPMTTASFARRFFSRVHTIDEG
ncbi:MAG: ATP-dependent DNA helicase [Candidatus Poseidoniaceae archaeon]